MNPDFCDVHIKSILDLPAHPTILVVDDEPSNIQVLAGILKHDCRVLFALSGEDALRLANSHKPDLILLDVQMPDLDGFAVCIKLKEDPILKDIPIIFITVMNEVQDEIQGLEVGAVDYITKPTNPAIVLGRVRKHLQIKNQRDLLRRMIVIDDLTGLVNRRGFEEAFDREWRLAVRNRIPISLILFDIDYFKAYNDFYGHLAGDDCLQKISIVLTRQVRRSGDVAARYGGEELVCLLSDTPMRSAESLAQSILSELTNLAIPHEASPVANHVTLSAGVATAMATQNLERGALLALADSHLYIAKNSGRNQISVGLLSETCLIFPRPEVKPFTAHDSSKSVVKKRPTLLIVDDEHTEIQILKDILENDYEILVALSGDDALKTVESCIPDLILLDITMEDLNGFSVCSRLKENPFVKDIPVIFITSLSEVSNEVQGLIVGGVDYITKPAQPAIVKTRIRTHLKIKSQRDNLQRLSVLDGLTGLLNRRGFDEAFDREWCRAQRKRSPISLLMADIDYFKRYNDYYGHPEGDRCLQSVARIFHYHMNRPGDLAARYGGEEFVCLLPDTDSAGTERVAKEIVYTLSTLGIRHESSAVAQVVTVSIGISTAVPSVRRTQRELLTMADDCLYQAKNDGRNQIKICLSPV
ncbi:two-component system, cell cycle response regulator [Gammaproteobacteria bacterium]